MPIIGREPPADIVVPAPMVSARHAEITHYEGDTYILTDLGSANGTYVNDHRITRAVIRLTDRVRLGSFAIDLRAYEHMIPRGDAYGGGMPQFGPPARPIWPAVTPPAGVPAGRHSDRSGRPPTPGTAKRADEPEARKPRKERESSAPKDAGPLRCPSCGSTDVVALAVLKEKKQEIKVSHGGCFNCMGCLICLLLIVILFPILVSLGLLGGLLGAVGLVGVGYFVRENLALILIVGGLILTAAIIVKMKQPKTMCQKCGTKF